MPGNSFGEAFRFTTWGESHGPGIGCVIDGVPPQLPLTEADIQTYLDRRRPGQSKFTTQRKEPDTVRIVSGTFEGLTTGTPVALQIDNVDQRSKDYGDIKDKFRPSHADYTYWRKYGIRDYRGGGRSSDAGRVNIPFKAKGHGEIKKGADDEKNPLFRRTDVVLDGKIKFVLEGQDDGK